MEKIDIMITITLIILALIIGIMLGKITTDQANSVCKPHSRSPEKYLYDVEMDDRGRAENRSNKETLAECLNIVRQSDNFQKNLFKKQWLDEGSNDTQ